MCIVKCMPISYLMHDHEKVMFTSGLTPADTPSTIGTTPDVDSAAGGVTEPPGAGEDGTGVPSGDAETDAAPAAPSDAETSAEDSTCAAHSMSSSMQAMIAVACAMAAAAAAVM